MMIFVKKNDWAVQYAVFVRKKSKANLEFVKAKSNPKL
jgi:hypothetical protein